MFYFTLTTFDIVSLPRRWHKYFFFFALFIRQPFKKTTICGIIRNLFWNDTFFKWPLLFHCQHKLNWQFAGVFCGSSAITTWFLSCAFFSFIVVTSCYFEKERVYFSIFNANKNNDKLYEYYEQRKWTKWFIWFFIFCKVWEIKTKFQELSEKNTRVCILLWRL